MPKCNDMEILASFYKCVGSDKTICKYCKKVFLYKGTATHLKTHLKSKHLDVYEKLSQATETHNDVLDKTSDFTIQEPTAECSTGDPLHPVFISVSQTNQQDSHSSVNNSSHCTTASTSSMATPIYDTQREEKFNPRKRPHDDTDDAILNALERLENISSVVNSTQQQTLHTQDEFHFFALSVAAQLRTLPLPIAVETQSKIQSTLSAARLSSMLLGSPTSPSLCNYNSSDQPTNSIETLDTNNMSIEVVEHIKHESDDA